MNRRIATYLILAFTLTFCTAGCSLPPRNDTYAPILGPWITERDIVMSIHETPGYGVAAFVVQSPGFYGAPAEPDAPVITHIVPLGRDGYRGYFPIPGQPEPIAVRLAISRSGILVIGSWDSQAGGGIMQWHRAGSATTP